MSIEAAGVEDGSAWHPGRPVLALQAWLDRGIDVIARRRWWDIWTAVIAGALGMVLAVPDLNQLRRTLQWNYTIAHSQGALFGVSDPGSRVANLSFRVVPRMIGKVLFFSQPWEFAVMQVLAAGLLLVLLARIIDEALGDRHLAVVATVGSVGIWAVASGWVDFRGNFDALAIALLVLAMWARPPLLVFVAALAATFTDERAVFALPIIALWHLQRDVDAAAVGLDREAQPRRAKTAAIIVLLAGVAHLVLRQLIKHRYGISEGTNHSPGNPWAQLNNYPNGIWGALEGYWLLVVAGLIGLWHAGRRWTVVIAAGTVAVILGVGLSVFDISRSVPYVFPVLPLALLGLRATPRAWVRGAVWISAAICLVWPLLYAADDRKVAWIYPAPLEVLHRLGLG